MNDLKDMTFYRFLSEIRSFLSKLTKDPIHAQPSKYMKDNGFSRTKMINDLIKKGVLERNEKILEPSKTGKEKVQYSVKFKIRKKNFETKIERYFIKEFEKNIPSKETLDECDGMAAGAGDAGSGEGLGGTSSASVGELTQRGDVGFDTVIGMMTRPGYLGDRKKKKGEPKPENILGKDINEGKKKPRRIYITEEQLQAILGEDGVTSTFTVGAMGDYTAQGLVLKTSDGKEDPCAKAGKIKVKMVMDK